MHKYIKPEITLCKFAAEDIITVSSAVTPSDASGYQSADASATIQTNAAYVVDWTKE